MGDSPIRNWSQDYWFLDNSYETQIAYEGLLFPSVTHAFAAAQAGTLDLKIEIAKAPLPALEGLFLKIGEPPEGFDGPDVMRKLLALKFGFTSSYSLSPIQSTLATKLLITGKRPLIYGNSVCNQHWGDCSCSKHLATSGKNILGGLLMGVREKLVDRLTLGTSKDLLCNCKEINTSFFLYTHQRKLWLKPFCANCQAQCGVLLSKLADDNHVCRFDKEWFPGPKREPVNQQVQHIHPHYVQPSDDDLYDDERAAWIGHLGSSPISSVSNKVEKQLEKNVTLYLSGRIS